MANGSLVAITSDCGPRGVGRLLPDAESMAAHRLVSDPLRSLVNVRFRISCRLTYGGKFIRASIALNCGSLRIGSSSQVTLSACRSDSRNRSVLSKVRSAAALLPNWA